MHKYLAKGEGLGGNCLDVDLAMYDVTCMNVC